MMELKICCKKQILPRAFAVTTEQIVLRITPMQLIKGLDNMFDG